jgi:hypothetical protein
LSVWHWLVHVTGSDYTGTYGRIVPYSFWSGIAGSFAVSIVIWFFAVYAHRTCHTWWCLRPGRFEFADETRGLKYRLCRKCHPAHTGERLTRRRIDIIHRANRNRAA